MARRKQRKLKHRFICIPNDMLIVANVEERYRVEIALYVKDMPIRTVKMKIDEHYPTEKRLRKIVNEFCQKFVNQKYYSDPEIAQHAQDPVSYTHLPLPTTPYV